AALKQRHDRFHEAGCRLSDHGINSCYADFCDEPTAAAIFQKARSGKQVSHHEQRQFATFLMEYFGHLNAEKGWTMQLHLGALRNTNSRLMQQLGRDVGGDSIDDCPQ